MREMGLSGGLACFQLRPPERRRVNYRSRTRTDARTALGSHLARVRCRATAAAAIPECETNRMPGPMLAAAGAPTK